MHATRKINSDITYIGADDRRLALFENMFPIQRGVSYNSYVITDEKTALLDTADATVTRQFIENLEYALNGRSLDYLIVNHMEPDHCAVIGEIVYRYPNVTVVGNAKTFTLIDQFYGKIVAEDKKMVVKEGDTLSLGKHQLVFAMAPMVHWPEVMVTYDATDKILFSADAFGTFGTNNGNIFNDEVDYKSDTFVADARRYYTNIVGKYGPQTVATLKKASTLDIKMICPLHGPIWRTDLSFIIDKYMKWGSYEPEEKAVALFYSSVYGNTESAVTALNMKLAERGVRNIKAYDVSNTDVSVMIAEIFRCSTIGIISTTYNNGIFPKMANLLEDMKALNVQNRKVVVIDNGSWAPTAGKQLHEKLSQLKGMEILPAGMTIKSAMKPEQESQLDAIADEITKSLQ